ERAHHLLERTDAALAVKRRAVIAGAADRADAEPLSGDGVELAVAMPGDQRLGAMAFIGLDEWRQKMLAVPERKDRRLRRLHQFIHVCRVEAELVGAPDQAQILGREKTNSALDAAAAKQIANQLFQRAVFES